MTKATAPVKEIGYAQHTGYQWWMYENETTPELIWPQSVFVYDQMRRTDAQVTSVLRAVTLPVRRTPWRIDPNGARKKVVEFIADDLGLPVVGQNPEAPTRSKDRFEWANHLRQALLMLPFGHMFFEIVFRVDDKGEAAHLRKLAPRMPKTIQKINVAEDGGLISIEQYWMRKGTEPKPIPVDRLVAYVNDLEGGNWLGTSILRPAYKNWLLKDRLLRVQAQTIERNGMGIPLYKGQEDASAADLATGLAMAKAWRSGDAAGSSVPFGADLTLVGVSGSLPDAEPAIRYHDEQIARAVLAHFLNLGTQTGSWALGTTFADFFTLSLQTLAQQIADTATSHIIEDIVDVNFGPDEPAPRLVFDEIGSRQQATAQAISALVSAGIIQPDEVLEETSRQQYGLPPKAPESTRGPDGAPLNDPNAPPAPGAAPEGVPPPPTDGTEWVAASADPDEVDMGQALIVALAEFCGEIQAAAGPDFEGKHPRGPGGRFREVVGRIIRALNDWSKGVGPDDPLPESMFKREHVREAAKVRGVSIRRGASHEEIVDALLADVREKTRTNRQVGPKSAKFTLQKAPHQGKDVGVYRDSKGHVALFKENDRGERGAMVEKFDSIDELHTWASGQGETRLADWAAKERGDQPDVRPEPPKKAAVAKKAAPSPVDGDTKAPAKRAPVKKAAPGKAAREAGSAEPRLSAPEVIELQNMDALPHNSDWTIPAAPAAQRRVESLVKKGYLRYLGSGKMAMTPEGRDRARSEPLHPKTWEAQGKVPANPARTKAPPAADQGQVTQIASAFHEDWRKTRLQDDGTFEPRVKKTKDQAWIDAHGTDDVDIANSSYDELPEDWKAENKAAAEVVQGILSKHGGTVDLGDEKTRLQVGEEIHQAWLGRNAWAAGGDLDVPFADLPADEQAKDLDQVTVAMGALAPSKPAVKAPRKTPGKAPEPAGTVRAEGFDMRVVADGNGGYVGQRRDDYASPWRDAPGMGTGSTPKDITSRYPRGQWRSVAAPKAGRPTATPGKAVPGEPGIPAAVPGKKAVPRKAAAKASAAPQFDLERAMAEQGVSEAEIAEIRDLIRVERPRIVIGNELDDDIAAQMLFSREPRLKAFFDSHRAIYNHLVKEDKDKRTWTDQYAGQASEMQAKATRALRRAVAPGKPIVVRHGSESTLRDILTSGRMKSQHETGTSSGGYIDKALRADYEEMAFGLPHDLPAAQRPIYGYVAPRGLAGDHGGKLDQYGDIRVVLRDSVRPRTTVSAGDSLDRRAELTPMPIDAPDWHAAQPAAAKYTDLGDQGFQDLTYVEAQIHGGVKTGDIQEVVFGHEPEPATVAALDGAGVSWRVDAPGKASTALKEAPKNSPVDFLSRFDAATRAGLSPADAQAFADSGMSLDEWRASRAERTAGKVSPAVAKVARAKAAKPRPNGDGPSLLSRDRSDGNDDQNGASAAPSREVRPSLKSAATTAEVGVAARSEAKRISGRDIEFNLGDAEPQLARHYSEGVLQGLERFPDAPVGAVRVADFPQDGEGEFTWAHAVRPENGGMPGLFEIEFNRNGEAWEEANEILAMKQARGIFAYGDVQGLALHEFGHVVHEDAGTTWQASGLAWKWAEAKAAADRPALPAPARRRWWQLGRGRNVEVDTGVSHDDARVALMRELSFYAATNRHELAAEAFADVMVNGDQASEVSRLIMQQLEAKLRETRA